MKTYIVLLRGINVGGRNRLPMKDLKGALHANGFEDVQTYIQSGNIVLSLPDSSQNPALNIKQLIKSEFAISPEVFVLDEPEFQQTLEHNPYAEFEGKCVHFYYCQQAPKIDQDKLLAYADESERYQVIDNVFYLHAPKGIGRSKLVANIEACLGVAATGRNLNTVKKLHAMLA